MKKVILLLLICGILEMFNDEVFGLTQIKIPLSNTIGVPYYKDERGIFVEGFEIDKNNNFYFLGGKKSILSKFTKDKKEIYRKTYNEFLPSKLYIWDENIIVFDNKYHSNSLFVINPDNGVLRKKIPQIIKNGVNAFNFMDSFLVAEIFDCKNKGFSGLKTLCLQKYDFSGKYISESNNIEDLPRDFIFQKFHGPYLGCWKNLYFFWDIEENSDKFYIQNKIGNIIEFANVDEKLLGETFFEGFEEHRKLRNGNLYILGKKGNNALITIIPLAELFPKYNKLSK